MNETRAEIRKNPSAGTDDARTSDGIVF
jgi:hypothetical protein